MNGRFYLVAQVRPDMLQSDRFFLAAWLQRDDEPEEPLYQAPESVSRQAALAGMHELLRRLVGSVSAMAEDPVLELILPRSLMTHSIDQWQIDDELSSPVGTTYPLVLRSFDRLNTPSMYGNWGRNWHWIKQHDRSAGSDAVREVKSHDLPMVQALRAALLRDGPPAIVLMLTPLPHRDALHADAFTAGLRGGASIMLWSRKHEVVEDLAASVREACADGLINLRRHVFDLRLQALEEGIEQVGSHTVIVFDDYDRIPEEFRGRARLRPPLPVEAL